MDDYVFDTLMPDLVGHDRQPSAFIVYLFLSLYVCLLFHLKVESEEARKAIALPYAEPNPNTLRQDQRYLSSSMRRLTGLISIVAERNKGG